jgi:hypothetical protein
MSQVRGLRERAGAAVRRRRYPGHGWRQRAVRAVHDRRGGEAPVASSRRGQPQGLSDHGRVRAGQGEVAPSTGCEAWGCVFITYRLSSLSEQASPGPYCAACPRVRSSRHQQYSAERAWDSCIHTSLLPTAAAAAASLTPPACSRPPYLSLLQRAAGHPTAGEEPASAPRHLAARREPRPRRRA